MKVKKFKPKTGLNLKALLVWVAAFAVVGFVTILITRAATPGISYSVDSSIPDPTNVKTYVDDRTVTVSWTPLPQDPNGPSCGYRKCNNPSDYNHNVIGYYVSWGTGGKFTSARQTEGNSIQIQPLVNGTAYNIKVQSVQGTKVDVSTPGGWVDEVASEFRANGKVSPGVPATATPSSARVDKLRQEMTGFFDDFNTAAGALDETKWNVASSSCVPPGETGAFINNQFHAHTQVRSSMGDFTFCDRGQTINRPRAIFDTSGKTEANPGVMTFDFDGVTQGRDKWYIDLIPTSVRKNGVPVDITMHASIGDDDKNDPMMLRISQTSEGLGIDAFNDNKDPQTVETNFKTCKDFNNNIDFDGNWCGGNFGPVVPGLSPLPELPLDYDHPGARPNVRRHWRVEVSPTKVKVFVDSVLMIDAKMPSFLANNTKWIVHNNLFSYTTGKDNDKNPTTSLLHWDNFGFNGPAPSTVVHNYIDGGADGQTPYVARGLLSNQTPNGNRTLKINIPDPIGTPVKARLMFTIGAYGFQSYTWQSGDKFIINGKTYNYGNPSTDNMLPPGMIDTPSTAHNLSDGILLNPADLKQGLNDIQSSFGQLTAMFNMHIELEYAKGTEPSYTQPTQIFSSAKFLPAIQPTMASHNNYLFVEQDFGLPSGVLDSTVPVPVPPVTGDTTKPTVSLTSPAANTSVQAGTTINAAANASDNVGVSKVDFYLGGTFKGSDTSSPYTFSIPTTGLNTGNYSLTAIAQDAAGNSQTSTAVPISVTAAPQPPTTSTKFITLPVNAALPTESECASRVKPSAETRGSTNSGYNATKGTGGNYTYSRVTGNYSGTTDEIIQWAACKWGVDEDLFRAQAVKESYWFQNAIGDFTSAGANNCTPVYPVASYPNQAANQCPESIGLLQVRWNYHQSAFFKDSANTVLTNNAVYSTAYNADYYGAVWRSCYNGELGWLNTVERGSEYAAGDIKGCQGVWFSGRWHTAAADQYIADVQDILNNRVWETSSFKTFTTNNPIKVPPTTNPTPTPEPTATPPSTPTTVGPGTYDDHSGGYDTNWAYGFRDGEYLGSDTYTNVAGATATLKFTGTKIDIFGAKDACHGQASFSIDGGTPVTIDYYAATRQDQASMFTSSTLSSGTHTVTIKVLASKNASSCGNYITIDKFTVSATTPPPADTTAPSVSITAPAANATVSNTVTVTANATDAVGVTSVSFYLDNATTPFSTISASPYSTQWNTALTTNASHTIVAKAKDAAGNTGTSAGITVKVNNVVPDTTAPTTDISAPLNGATVKGIAPVTATANDNVGIARVDFLVDGIVRANDTASPYSFAWDTTSFTNANHTIATYAYDAAGNKGQSTAKTITVSNTVVTPTPSRKPGDVNGDGRVNQKDYSIMMRNWGKKVTPGTNGDLNKDGIVNSFDLAILLANWGK